MLYKEGGILSILRGERKEGVQETGNRPKHFKSKHKKRDEEKKWEEREGKEKKTRKREGGFEDTGRFQHPL